MIDLFPSRTIALELFGLNVHWYGLLYMAGFLGGWILLPRLQHFRDLELKTEEWSSVLTATVLGVIIGGRLGYVLFYDPSYYWANPLAVLYVWEGGMASHGGFLGVTIALLYTLRNKRDQWLKIADVVVIPVAIGLALGRVGNVINQELYGSVTTLPWGIAIPGVEGLRHPTHVYAVIKDLLIASMCFIHLRHRPFVAGHTAAIFFMMYATLRFLNEFLRVPTHSTINLGIVEITRGQLLTIPVFLIGVALWWIATRRRA